MATSVAEYRIPAPWDFRTLPEPSISFTIPSLHHSTHLECRIYHPKQSSPCLETKAAIIAHPYTPMGGCFDDHVLHTAGLEFLQQGYILGLFNLRGAGASQGHTSWTSKPEQDDYCSFVGFLSCYLDELQRCYTEQSGSQEQHKQRVLVLGGYSYGSFLVRQLPDIATILSPFVEPVPGTAAAEIKLRGAHLAQEHIRKHPTVKSYSRNLTAGSCCDSLVCGGDECQSRSQKASRERHLSLEIIKKNIEKTRTHFSRHHHNAIDNHESEKKNVISECIQALETRYLLISPLLPPVSAFLALSSHWWKADSAAEERLRNHPSLAIWGSSDFSTSSKRLNNWARALKEFHGSRFEYTEFPGVGHFWMEANAEMDLRKAVRLWIEKCDED